MPKATPLIPLPGILLNKNAALPLRHQLYEQLGQAIRAGHLPPGTRLPSTRAFARELGISRTTVEEAYQDLYAEGYIEGQVGAGTYVTRQLPQALLHTRTLADISASSAKPESMRLSRRGQSRIQSILPPGFRMGDARHPFRIGLPALDSFPQQEWARAIAKAARQASTSFLNYPDPAGYYPLRAEIATYLTISRGVNCTADQVLIIAGAQAGLTLAAHLLLDAGDAAWIEDPGYTWARVALEEAGATLVPVPIDEEGIRVASGRTLCPNARLAYVTPSHQFPLGVTMSLTRRYDLLRWAHEAQAWIIEDDYDSEYRYIGRPIPALQGLAEGARVIYLGTFSKVLFPALRLGYMVVPPALIEAFVTAQRAANILLPTLEQAALATFMQEGYFARHIRRMRALYAERGNVLRDYATRYLGNMLTIERPVAGLHLVGWLPEGVHDGEMARQAELYQVTAPPLSAYRLQSTGRGGVLLGYASLTENEIKDGMQRLAQAWEHYRQP